MAASAPFRVELDVYRGPLDLLLYLVRKHEIGVEELSLAGIARQFMEFLEVLQEIDVNLAGDFLETATLLAEMKSRSLLPRPEEEQVEAAIEEPQQDLVRRLLEFKHFRDAASVLEERGRSWQDRFPRTASEAPPERDLADEPIHELEIWDLVSAFSRVIRDNLATRPANIVYDETPIHVYIQQIHQRLRTEGRVLFSEMFRPGMHKSALVGVFLAIMELVRHHGVQAEQEDLFGDIALRPGAQGLGDELDLSQVDEYDARREENEGERDGDAPSGDSPAKPR